MGIKGQAVRAFIGITWPFFAVLAAVSRFTYKGALKVRFRSEWDRPPTPEWFDHEYDLAFFDRWRRPHFFERGVYLQEVLKPGMYVLDLCCGDGSVTALFIAPIAECVVGVDFDASAIRAAKRKYGRFQNIRFDVQDIRKLSVPPMNYDVIAWDAAIEHFTQDEVIAIMASIRRSLKPGGLLVGSSIAKSDHIQHHDHEHEFNGVADMRAFLERHFKNVVTWDRKHSDRTSLYFRCSDADRDLLARSP